MKSTEMKNAAEEHPRIEPETIPDSRAKATSQEIEGFVDEILRRRVERVNNRTTEDLGNMWETLNDVVIKELEKLRKLQPAVEASFAKRVKTKESLFRKITKMQEMNEEEYEKEGDEEGDEEGEKKGGFQNLKEITAGKWDIAGTRIRLYFPLQLRRVREFILENQQFEQVQKPREFRERGWENKDQETRPYLERMGYYNADHFWIKLRRTKELLESIPNYNDEVVEIQVRTALMDAWAEVRHDLDYKNIFGWASGDELRVLDAIKGGIAAAEIMQDHLFMLRERRIEANKQAFETTVPRVYWDAILYSLQPRHRLLLERYGTEPPSEDYITVRVKLFFRGFNIQSPNDLQSKMSTLIKTKHQKKAMLRAEESLGGRPTLFMFIASFLIPKMCIEDIDRSLHYPFGGWMYSLDYRAAKWYAILRTVLRRMQPWVQDSLPIEKKRVQKRTISVTWHVFEYIATIFQTRDHENVIDGVNKLRLHYLREPDDNGSGTIWDQRALWLFAAVTLESFHIQFRGGGNSDLKIGDYHDLSRIVSWTGLKLTPADWECPSWNEGQRLAAKILGIDALQLRQATVFRALCQREAYPCFDEYILHCLPPQDTDGVDDIDINWQDPCGISILAAAAAFATPGVCEALLAPRQSQICVNLHFSDGLSLMHIAVLHANPTMAKLILARGDVDLKATWETDEETSARAPQWGSWDWFNTMEDNFLQWDYGWDKDNEYERELLEGALEGEVVYRCDKLSWTALELAKHRLLAMEESIPNDAEEEFDGEEERLKLYEIYHLLHTAAYSTELDFLKSQPPAAATPTSCTIALVEDYLFPTMKYTIDINVDSAFVALIPNSPGSDHRDWAVQRLLNLSSGLVHVALPTQIYSKQWTAHIVTIDQPPRILKTTIIEAAAAVKLVPRVGAEQMTFEVSIRPPMRAILFIANESFSYADLKIVSPGTKVVKASTPHGKYVGKFYAHLLAMAATVGEHIEYDGPANLAPGVELDIPWEASLSSSA